MHPLRKLGALLIENGKPYNTFNGFLGPFKVGHLYVDDARGNTVAECTSKETAKVLCDLLNKTYPKKARVEETLSAKDEKDVKNVGRFARDQAKANGQSDGKAAEIAKKAEATRRKHLA